MPAAVVIRQTLRSPWAAAGNCGSYDAEILHTTRALVRRSTPSATAGWGLDSAVFWHLVAFLIHYLR